MYQIEKYIRIVEDAPHLSESDLLSMSKAAQLLGVSYQTVDYYIRSGDLSAVTAPGKVTSHRRARRWVLLSEVEALAKERAVTVNETTNNHEISSSRPPSD